MKAWTVETLPWDSFDASKVHPRLLAQAKGASLVEANAADYVTYLKQVFAGEDHIIPEIERWGEEEKQHGLALRRWCELADPSFDFEAAMARFNAAFRIPLEAQASIRGDRARELVARCVVETGTTTFYSAMRDRSEEPVLKEICRRIAGDEVRHFNFFLKHLEETYIEKERLNRFKRFKTLAERISEVNDAELTYAYFAANAGDDFDPSKQEEYARHYMNEIVWLYQTKHFEIMIPFLSKAAGIPMRRSIANAIGKVFQKAFVFKYQTH